MRWQTFNSFLHIGVQKNSPVLHKSNRFKQDDNAKSFKSYHQRDHLHKGLKLTKMIQKWVMGSQGVMPLPLVPVTIGQEKDRRQRWQKRFHVCWTPIYRVSISATDKAFQCIPALLTEPHLQYTGTIKLICSSFMVWSTVRLSLIN